MTGRKTIVITGATGNLGRKIRAALEENGHELRLICLNPQNEPGVLTADMALYDEHWTAAFAGADIILHLAGNPRSESGWDTLIGPNIDAVANLYIAAQRHGVQRVVLASSVWAMRGRRFSHGVITAAETGDPGESAYGATKLFAERLGRAFALSHGIATVALRIGGCPPDWNEPFGEPPQPDWNKRCWLSDRDFCAGTVRAVESETTGFQVVNLTSRSGARWSLDGAEKVLGYVPQDERIVQFRRVERVRIAATAFAQTRLPHILSRMLRHEW